MKILEFNLDTAIRVSGDPALYHAAPFLEPMKQATLNLHAKYKGCTNCQKTTMRNQMKFVSNAMAALVLKESLKTPNGLLALKGIIKQILRADFEELLLRYMQDGKAQELKF